MAKLTLSNVANISGAESAAIGVINANSDAIETALENTLSRDGTAPNSMAADLDMDNNDILNVNAMDVVTLTVNGVDVEDIVGVTGATGAAGADGADGDDGWSPVFTLVTDGARSVLQVSDWTGGTGTKPTTGLYVGAAGLTAVIGDGVDVRGASGPGSGDLVAASNLADVANPATARYNLGLAIGTNVQAYDAELAALAGLTSAADKLPYFTGSGTAVLADFTAAGRALVDDADTTAQRATLGLVIGTNIREVLTATRTYYVRTDGSDANTGLVDSAGGAFLTLQKAVTTIQALDRSTYDVTVTIGAGTFTGGVFITGWGPGMGSVYFTGAGATTIISTTSEACVYIGGGARVIPAQMKLQTATSGSCIHAYGGSVTLGAGIEFGACAGTHIVAQAGGVVEMDVAYTISGNATYHMYCDNRGSVYTGSSKTVTASGARAFTTFAVAVGTGVIFGMGGTYSGTFTGSRYYAALNAVINTYGGGANYFPGNSAGATATGAQYA